MAIPNPNPNIADGIKSDNKTYSSNKIESLIKTATELPIPEAGDAGKVLAVNAAEDGYELDALATVATTGSYTDLSNKPTIPTIGSVDITATTSGYGNLANDGIPISVGHPFLAKVTSTEAIVTFYLNAAGTHYIPHVIDGKGDIIANTEVTMTVYYI